MHIWHFLWVLEIQTQVLRPVQQAAYEVSHFPTPENFTVDQFLSSLLKNYTGIQSLLIHCKIMIDVVVNHKLNESTLKDHRRVWEEPDSSKLPAALCRCLLASLSYCCYKRGQLINCANVDGSVHQGCLERVIFTFRSIFSLWIMGWWDEKWSWLLMILRSLQPE